MSQPDPTVANNIATIIGAIALFVFVVFFGIMIAGDTIVSIIRAFRGQSQSDNREEEE